MLGEAGLLRRPSANWSVISLGFHVSDFGEDLRPIRLASTRYKGFSAQRFQMRPELNAGESEFFCSSPHLVPEVGYADERNPSNSAAFGLTRSQSEEPANCLGDTSATAQIPVSAWHTNRGARRSQLRDRR